MRPNDRQGVCSGPGRTSRPSLAYGPIAILPRHLHTRIQAQREHVLVVQSMIHRSIHEKEGTENDGKEMRESRDNQENYAASLKARYTYTSYSTTLTHSQSKFTRVHFTLSLPHESVLRPLNKRRPHKAPRARRDARAETCRGTIAESNDRGRWEHLEANLSVLMMEDSNIVCHRPTSEVSAREWDNARAKRTRAAPMDTHTFE